MRSIYFSFLIAKAATETGQVWSFASFKITSLYYELYKAFKMEKAQLFPHLYTSFHLDSWLEDNLFPSQSSADTFSKLHLLIEQG